MAIGLLSCFFAFLLGQAIFHRNAGLIAAALCAVYWGFIYFEGELLDPALLIALSLSMFLVLWEWCRRPTWWRLAVAGLLAGLLTIVRENILLFVPIALLWVIWTHRRERMPGRGVSSALAFGLGALVAIAPVTIRNAVVAREFVLISCSGPVNLHIGNNVESDGVSARIPNLAELTGTNMWSWFTYDEIVKGLSRREGRPFTYSDAGRYFLAQAWNYIRVHPGRVLSLTLRRAALFWGPAEVSNNKSDENEKHASPTLRYLLAFPWASSLALLGVVFLIRDVRSGRGRNMNVQSAAWPAARAQGMIILMGAYTLASFASFLPFLAAGRFRMPLIPLLFLFGAYGLFRLGALIRGRDWRGTALTGGLGVAFFALASIPLVAYDASAAWYHTDRGLALAAEGKSAEAVAELRAALQENPGFVDAHVKLAGLLVQQGQLDEAMAHYREVLAHRSNRVDVRLAKDALLIDMGQPAEAEADLRDLIRSGHASADAHAQLGMALLGLGNLAEAISESERALALEPDHAVAHFVYGVALLRQGSADRALPHLRQATTATPDFAEAHRELGRAQAAVGSLAVAERSYRTALRLQPRSAIAAGLLGNLLLQQGRSADAVPLYRQVLSITPSDVGTRCNLALALGSQGLFAEAVAELQEAQKMAPGNAAVLERLDYFKAQAQQSPGSRR